MTGAAVFDPRILPLLLPCLALLFLTRPLLRLLRLVMRTSLGLALLTLFAPIGSLIGVHLGINPFNALILGLLGAPGFGLLLMLQWVLR